MSTQLGQCFSQVAVLMGKNLPPKPSPDAIAKRIETRRKELGWTLADLAREAGLKAPSYVLHIEKGDKVPSEDVAERLARALGEDVESFTAWARLRTGTTLDDALHSVLIAERAVRAIERDPRHQVRWAANMPLKFVAQGITSQQAKPTQEPHSTIGPTHGPMLLKKRQDPIILLENFQDPDAHTVASAKKLTIAVDADEIVRGHVAELVAPFAYKLTRKFGRRAPNLLPPGYYAILTRRILPIEAHEAYAVRVEGRVELGFVHWDGERLLLLPHIDPADLVVLRAKSDAEVLRHMAGKVVIVLQPEIVKTR
jgi:transcriptional regulator with XRE-family HTH domain